MFFPQYAGMLLLGQTYGQHYIQWGDAWFLPIPNISKSSLLMSLLLGPAKRKVSPIACGPAGTYRGFGIL